MTEEGFELERDDNPKEDMSYLPTPTSFLILLV